MSGRPHKRETRGTMMGQVDSPALKLPHFFEVLRFWILVAKPSEEAGFLNIDPTW